MLDNDWKKISQISIEIITKETGISLDEKNFFMIESRLLKRIYSLGLKSSSEYLLYLNNNRASEEKIIISLLTTHHTAFFREYFHFEDIEKNHIKRIVEEKSKNRSDQTLRIWSAACSRGQECYSLSMFFHKLKKNNILKNLDYKIFGTDVDEESIQYAKNGVYLYKELMQSPISYIHGNWSRGLKEISNYVKPKPHIKDAITFEVANLLQLGDLFKKTKFDIIFCRNVLIYFDQKQVKQIIEELLQRLEPHGILILGISESITRLNLPVTLTSNNIYFHKNADIKAPTINSTPAKEKTSIKIICVDDSPTILALLKKILTIQEGFEIVATASNTKELREKLRTTPADLITLDIHMPDETGIQYLKKEFNSKHPPVIVLSSIARDGAETAKEALRLGASDYIEKPDLKNLDESSNEIKFKINTIFKENKSNISTKIDEKNKIKLLIVDDSQTIHKQIKKIIENEPMIEAIGFLQDPRELENFILKDRPDVITLDMNMPYMNGVEVVKNIISKHLIPTIIVTSMSLSDGNSVMEALDFGAFDYFQKPSMTNMEEEGRVLIEKIKTAKNAKVRVHRSLSINIRQEKKQLDQNYLIAIGSSTGGTEAIKTLLEGLPENIPPILIVQHIPPVFSQAFADRLNACLPFKVLEAKDNQDLNKNCVYIAPGDRHMIVVREGTSFKIKIISTEKVNNHRPSVDVLFESIHDLNLKKSLGIILTGMGNDGAKGLKKLHDQGTKTIAQNEESCVVFGMPNEAIKLKAVDYVESIDKISNKIVNLIQIN